MAKEVRYTKAQLVKSALHWGAQNIESLIDAYTAPSGEVTDIETIDRLKSLRRQMIEYRNQRFGKPHDPIAGLPKIDALTRKLITE